MNNVKKHILLYKSITKFKKSETIRIEGESRNVHFEVLLIPNVLASVFTKYIILHRHLYKINCRNPKMRNFFYNFA